MTNSTISDDYYLLNVTVGVTPTVLNSLVRAIIPTLPGMIVQVAITPATDITAKDVKVGHEITLKGTITKVFPSASVLDALELHAGGNVVCAIELFVNR